MQLFVCQKEKIDGSSLRNFNLGEIPQIIAVCSTRLRSNQIGSVATGNLFILTFRHFLICTPQVFPRAYMGEGRSICPFLFPFSSSHSFKCSVISHGYFLLVFLIFTYIAIFLSFLSSYIMVVIFSSPISSKSLMIEKKKAYDSCLDFRPPKQSLAKHLSCLPPRCLSWSLSYFSSSHSPNYSGDFLISLNLVT